MEYRLFCSSWLKQRCVVVLFSQTLGFRSRGNYADDEEAKGGPRYDGELLGAPDICF